MVKNPSRIDALFSSLRAAGKKAFIAYVCAGDPDPTRSRQVVHALVEAGADLIELGVPFSDPLADGIVNQMAAQRALEAGMTTSRVLQLIGDCRKEGIETPIILFTYLNPIYTYGFARFHADAAAAGADGVLILDMPPDEALCHQELADHEGLQHIRLIAPTSPPDRIASIAKASEGFIYYVSREGVTGARADMATAVDEHVAQIRAETSTPVAVGFGISTPDQAAAVARLADGVVVGSAIVNIVEKEAESADLAEKVKAFVKPLVDAVKSV